MPALPGQRDKHPLILQPVTIVSLIRFLVQLDAERLDLIICASQTVFEADLLSAAPAAEDDDHLRPTLQLLHDTRKVAVSFCDSVPALHALLTMKSADGPAKPHPQRSILVLVDCIKLLRSTPSYSAQGVSRVLAAAVSAAHHRRTRLIVAECLTAHSLDTSAREDEAMTGQGWNFEANEGSQRASEASDPWQQQVPILNATAKSFGPGERGWVGRTVEVKALAETWFTFRSIK